MKLLSSPQLQNIREMIEKKWLMVIGSVIFSSTLIIIMNSCHSNESLIEIEQIKTERVLLKPPSKANQTYDELIIQEQTAYVVATFITNASGYFIYSDEYFDSTLQSGCAPCSQ